MSGEPRFRCTGCDREYGDEIRVRMGGLVCERCFAPLETVSGPRRARGSGSGVVLLDRLGPYTLGKVLGRGSMGVVYEARSDDGRSVALKVMSGGDDDPLMVARFEREAALAARIRHPNVVSVIDRGSADGSFYYVMELCRGPTLKDRIATGALPPHEAARLVRDLADGVAAAHRAGVVHRDLKPANVILAEPAGLPRVTDFGLARDALAASSLTKTGDTIGTPYYMAPEQVRAEKDVDGRADVYSLGVVLFECLAGKRPFEARSTPELGRLILAGTRRALRELAPGVPPGLEAIAMKAFSLARTARYEGALELRDDLDRFLRGERPRAAGAAPLRTLSRGKIAALLAVLVAGAGLALHVAGIVMETERARTETALRERQQREALAVKKQLDERARRETEELLALAHQSAREKRPGALDAWRRARAAGKGAPKVELAYGRFLLRRNHVKEALEVLRPLATPGDLEARSALAAALLRATPPRLPDACAELAALVKADPNGARGQLAEACLAFLDGRRDEAQSAAERSLRAEELPEAHALIARALVHDWQPARAAPRWVREALDPAELARVDERARVALGHADRAVLLAPDDVDAITARSEVRVSLHVNRVYVHERPMTAEYEAFMAARRRDLHDAIELAEGEPEERSLVLRGRLRMFFPQDGDAAADLDAALALDARDVEALLLRGIVAQVERRDPLPWFARALDVDAREAFAVARHFQIFKLPSSDLAFRADQVRRGAHLQQHRSEHQARLDARIARASEPARAALREGLDRLGRGLPAREAIPPFEKAVLLAPDDPVPLVELGRALMGRERLDDALAVLDRARALHAEPLELGALRGDVLLRAGRGAEARLELAAVERDARDALQLIARTGVLRASGDFAGARATGVRAVLAAPADPDAHRALAAALLDGPDPEPDAALAEGLRALELDLKADGESLQLVLLGRVLGGLSVPHPEDAVLADIEQTLDTGARELERVAPSTRFHARAARALLAAPAPGARALGQAELALAKKREEGD